MSKKKQDRCCCSVKSVSRPVFRKTALIVDHHNAAWPFVAPTPEHEIDVIRLCSPRKTVDSHPHIASRHQPVRQCLRQWRRTFPHFALPGRTVEFKIGYVVLGSLRLVERIENGIGIDLIGA